MAESVDVVVTWVDGAWPGYAEALRRQARRPVDLNPNRTRDNVDLLRYNLRSLARYMPWLRRVFLVTARPQVPAWLNIRAPKLTLVHHDTLFSPAHLPCFNSFAIVAHLARIPGLSRRFLYMEDDRLLGAPVTRDDLFAPCGRPWLYGTGPATDRACAAPGPRQHPWNAALAYSNHLLDTAYGPMRRTSLKHAPVVLDVAALGALEARFAEPLERTRQSPFRAPGNVAVEHLAPWDLWHRGGARLLPQRRARRATAYWGLDNFLLRQQLGLWRLRRRAARFMCLNDNFGPAPRPACERAVRNFLDRMLPWPSPFEQQQREARAG